MKKYIHTLAILIILGAGAVLGTTAIQVLASYTSAPLNPPACSSSIEGCNTPINVGSTAQFKAVGLGIGYPLGATALHANDVNGGNVLFDVLGKAMSNELFTGTLYVTVGTGYVTGGSGPKIKITGKVLAATGPSGNAEWRSLPAGCTPITNPVTNQIPINCDTSGTTDTQKCEETCRSGYKINPGTVSCLFFYENLREFENRPAPPATYTPKIYSVDIPYLTNVTLTNGTVVQRNTLVTALDGHTFDNLIKSVTNNSFSCTSYDSNETYYTHQYIKGSATCVPQ